MTQTCRKRTNSAFKLLFMHIDEAVSRCYNSNINTAKTLGLVLAKTSVFFYGAKKRKVNKMKINHSIQARITRLAILPILLISVMLLAYATNGGISNTTSTLEDSMRETADISALAIEKQLVESTRRNIRRLNSMIRHIS